MLKDNQQLNSRLIHAHEANFTITYGLPVNIYYKSLLDDMCFWNIETVFYVLTMMEMEIIMR